MSKYLIPLSSSYLNKKAKFLEIDIPISNTKFLPLQFRGLDISICNALRRIFMSEVPTGAFAPEHVEVLSNTSEYHREVMIDRLGFIVIDTQKLLKYDLTDLRFMICNPTDSTKPFKNETTSVMLVNLYQSLSIYQKSTQTKIPVEELIPYDSLLLTLNPDKEFYAQMTATLGTKNQHARWQSSIAMYKFETPFDQTSELETSQQLMEYNGYENKEPTGIIITVESIGRLDSNVVVQRGIEVLKQKLNDFKQHLSNYENSEIVSVEIDPNIKNLVKLKIVNENHTLGTILESHCLMMLKSLIATTAQKYIKETDTTLAELELELLLESLSAYKKSHPLNNYIELSLRTPQTYELVFPAGQHDEVSNPAIRLILLTMDNTLKICDDLLNDAKVLF